MKVAIIGAGFTGLSAGYYASEAGHEVSIFEQNSFLGGLAGGIDNFVTEPPPWEWDLEQFYHHWFTNDDLIFQLAEDIGTRNKIIIKRPKTATFYKNSIHQLDSPISLLKFPHLSWTEKVRTGITLVKLKYLYNMENSKALENVTAHVWLQKKMGASAYKKLFEPLLKGKFEEYYKEINMRWLWARIYKRTPKLAYYEGGFGAFARDIAHAIEKNNGNILLDTSVTSLDPKHEKTTVKFSKDDVEQTKAFDAVIVTTTPFTLTHLIKDIPAKYEQQLTYHEGIGAFVLLLSLKHKLMPDTYWLNINEDTFPFLAVVEHTNFMDKKYYNNEHIVYVGDYLPKGHPHMKLEKDKMIQKFTPYLKKINPLFSPESLNQSYLLKTPYAQPIVRKNHKEKILPIKTPLPNIYLATMAQVYPWDRGTNYAVGMGKRAARL